MLRWVVCLSLIPAGCHTCDINNREWPKTLLLHPLPRTLFNSPSSNPGTHHEATKTTSLLLYKPPSATLLSYLPSPNTSVFDLSRAFCRVNDQNLFVRPCQHVHRRLSLA